MTAEVLVMNKHGVALAADSAVTTQGRKVYNSANKLFRLSKRSAIGILVYQNSSLNGIPWELLIKSFRSENKKTQWLSVEQCASEFLEYLRKCKIVEKQINEAYVRLVLENLNENLLNFLRMNIRDKTLSQERNLGYLKAVVKRFALYMSERTIYDGINEEFINKVQIFYESFIKEKIRDFFLSVPENIVLDEQTINEIKDVALRAIYSKNDIVDYSGIVIVGYGDREYFPSYIEYSVYGLLFDKVLYSKKKQDSISLQKCAAVEPFAQTDVVETFLTGINPSFTSNIESLLNEVKNKNVVAVVQNVLSKFGNNASLLAPMLISTLEEYHRQIGKVLMNKIDSDKFYNSSEIYASLASLPIPDLAQMAKSLVEITSFKRMITSDIGTVGGPIDVAVISKGDGFIWIDRKHYFEKEKNEHFFDDYKER